MNTTVAGGISNTISKLCNNLGLGNVTSVYASMSSRLGDGGSAIESYLSVYWYAAACAGVSLLLVPSVTLRTLGHQKSEMELLTAELMEEDSK